MRKSCFVRCWPKRIKLVSREGEAEGRQAGWEGRDRPLVSRQRSGRRATCPRASCKTRSAALAVLGAGPRLGELLRGSCRRKPTLGRQERRRRRSILVAKTPDNSGGTKFGDRDLRGVRCQSRWNRAADGSGSEPARPCLQPSAPGRLGAANARRAPSTTGKLPAARDEWKPESAARRAGGGAAAGGGGASGSRAPAPRRARGGSSGSDWSLVTR